MIPRALVTEWRAHAPWPTDAQVEQDLVLSRALVEIFSSPSVGRTLAFRGGTALHKLMLERPGRYSEDIDLVQLEAGGIGPVLDALRGRLDHWLGEPKRKHGYGRVTLIYRFDSTSIPVQSMRLKVEINTREHFTVLGHTSKRLAVGSRWFSGAADVTTYPAEELLGTKLRALYQRKKGRDLYDLWLALTSLPLDAAVVVRCFQRYIEAAGAPVSRAEFESNLRAKLTDASFVNDLTPLLPTGAAYNVVRAAALVERMLVEKLRGEPWKGPTP